VNYRGLQGDFATFGPVELSGRKGRRKNRYQENHPIASDNGQTYFTFSSFGLHWLVKGPKAENAQEMKK
jgi:hypothetical protein